MNIDAAQGPKGIYIELTDICNLRCPMCRSQSTSGDILPLQTFSQIAANLFSTATFVDLRGWGESTVLPEFDSYLTIASQYEVTLKLITNGTVRNPNLWRSIARRGMLVGVSVDAADADLFRIIRGGAELAQVKKNVTNLMNGFHEFGFSPADHLYFCITVSGRNFLQLPSIVKMGVALGVRNFKLEPICLAENHPDLLRFHIEALRPILKETRQVAESLNAIVELSASLIREDSIKECTNKLCIHPWSYLYVNCRGRLGFCDHLNGREEYTFGNWEDGDFAAFWNGEMMSRLRLEHKRKLTGENIALCSDCNWCYDRRYVDLEHLIDPSWENFRQYVQ